jgi:predicted NBD/HSP70 family sugar kinase
VKAVEDALPLTIALTRPDGTCFVREVEILPHAGENQGLNTFYLERLIKYLLWQRGGSRVLIAGCDALADRLSEVYRAGGERAFDVDLIGSKVFLEPVSVSSCALSDLPAPNEPSAAPGGHLDGCRIGFDLGGSDRKCAAVIDGEVVFSEEIAWNPYFETNPQYHIDGINDSLKRAAAHLPRVDAIGGSAAGDYVNNEVRVASLFRGVSEEDFERHVRRLFLDLRREWDNVPLDVLNDGEVTALAGSMSLNDGALLGVAMGTSEAAGYCDPDQRLTCWLNELAFAPVDYREDAPVDEWSGDRGCGVQYFSQQAVARLAPLAGIEFPADTPFADQLIGVQQLMATGDPRARTIYETLGVYLGYAIPHYAAFCEIRHLMLLGRVTSGEGGEVIIQEAEKVLNLEFPERAKQIQITTPDEKMKRHGQAIAAASLPVIPGKE